MRVLIFEDEIPAAQRLRNLLAEAAPDLEIVDVLDSGKDAVAYLQKNPPPDLIISDIELADGLCFDIFSSLHIQVPVIFATAYNQYAIRAFEANAIDYLLKPVKRESLERSLEKFRMRMGLEKPAVNYSEISDTITQKLPAPPKKYLVRYGQKMLLLHPNEVAWYYSHMKSSFAVLPSGKTYPVDESLTQIESDLDANRYFRINRNLIVVRGSILEMKRESKGRLHLTLEPTCEDMSICTVSAERAPDFRKWIS